MAFTGNSFYPVACLLLQDPLFIQSSKSKLFPLAFKLLCNLHLSYLSSIISPILIQIKPLSTRPLSSLILALVIFSQMLLLFLLIAFPHHCPKCLRPKSNLTSSVITQTHISVLLLPLWSNFIGQPFSNCLILFPQLVDKFYEDRYTIFLLIFIFLLPCHNADHIVDDD